MLPVTLRTERLLLDAPTVEDQDLVAGIAPASVAYRDGSHPQSWHGVLDASGSRDQKPGWPA